MTSITKCIRVHRGTDWRLFTMSLFSNIVNMIIPEEDVKCVTFKEYIVKSLLKYNTESHNISNNLHFRYLIYTAYEKIKDYIHSVDPNDIEILKCIIQRNEDIFEKKHLDEIELNAQMRFILEKLHKDYNYILFNNNSLEHKLCILLLYFTDILKYDNLKDLQRDTRSYYYAKYQLDQMYKTKDVKSFAFDPNRVSEEGYIINNLCDAYEYVFGVRPLIETSPGYFKELLIMIDNGYEENENIRIIRNVIKEFSRICNINTKIYRIDGQNYESTSFNIALMNATSEWFLCVDDDDINISFSHYSRIISKLGDINKVNIIQFFTFGNHSTSSHISYFTNPIPALWSKIIRIQFLKGMYIHIPPGFNYKEDVSITCTMYQILKYIKSFDSLKICNACTYIWIDPNGMLDPIYDYTKQYNNMCMTNYVNLSTKTNQLYRIVYDILHRDNSKLIRITSEYIKKLHTLAPEIEVNPKSINSYNALNIILQKHVSSILSKDDSTISKYKVLKQEYLKNMYSEMNTENITKSREICAVTKNYIPILAIRKYILEDITNNTTSEGQSRVCNSRVRFQGLLPDYPLSEEEYKAYNESLLDIPAFFPF